MKTSPLLALPGLILTVAMVLFKGYDRFSIASVL